MGLEHLGIVVGEEADAFSREHRAALTGQRFQNADTEPYYVLFEGTAASCGRSRRPSPADASLATATGASVDVTVWAGAPVCGGIRQPGQSAGCTSLIASQRANQLSPLRPPRDQLLRPGGLEVGEHEARGHRVAVDGELATGPQARAHVDPGHNLD